MLTEKERKKERKKETDLLLEVTLAFGHVT